MKSSDCSSKAVFLTISSPLWGHQLALSLFYSQRMSFDKSAGSDTSFQHFLLFSHVLPCFYLLLGCVTVLRQFRLFHSCTTAKGEIWLSFRFFWKLQSNAHKLWGSPLAQSGRNKSFVSSAGGCFLDASNKSGRKQLLLQKLEVTSLNKKGSKKNGHMLRRCGVGPHAYAFLHLPDELTSVSGRAEFSCRNMYHWEK